MTGKQVNAYQLWNRDGKLIHISGISGISLYGDVTGQSYVTCCGCIWLDSEVKPTMSLKKIVTQSYGSGSTGRPSLSAADTCRQEAERIG